LPCRARALTDLGGSLLLIPICMRKTIKQKGQITCSYRSQTNEHLGNMDRPATMKLQQIFRKCARANATGALTESG